MPEKTETTSENKHLEVSKELEVLFQINSVAKKINSTLEQAQIIDYTIAELPELLKANKCSIFLYDEEKEELVMAAHNHYDLDRSFDLRISIHSNQLLSRAVRRGKSLLIMDIEEEFGLKNRSKYKSKSSMITLLQSGDKLLGVININDKMDGTEFSEWDFSIALNINEHLATAISNAQLFSQTRRLSITDGLTDLFTHRYFQETLDREISRAERYKKDLSLMMLDIDFFKKVNDTYGHQAGDCVLQSLAKLIKGHLRSSDYACRYGGEEFALILTDTNAKAATISANRIRQDCENMVIKFADQELKITVSIGVSGYEEGTHKQIMVEKADRCLYKAKEKAETECVWPMNYNWSSVW